MAEGVVGVLEGLVVAVAYGVKPLHYVVAVLGGKVAAVYLFIDGGVQVEGVGGVDAVFVVVLGDDAVVVDFFEGTGFIVGEGLKMALLAVGVADGVDQVGGGVGVSDGGASGIDEAFKASGIIVAEGSFFPPAVYFMGDKAPFVVL